MKVNASRRQIAEPKIQFLLNLQPELRCRVADLALKLKTSDSAIMRRAIAEFLDRTGGRP